MKKFLLPLSILISGAVSAQTKIKDGTLSSPVTPNVAAVIELESNNKGLLLTRVELSNTTTWGLTGTGTQGMLVYNTSAAITSSDPAYPVLSGGKGVYYWDGTGWVGTKMTASLEPWNVESTSNSASLNTQNIYQNGNIGIGDFSTTNAITKLDVRGAVRGGKPHADELSGASPIGIFSVAFGGDNKASEYSSIALGDQNIASGPTSTAIGAANVASGVFTTALGSNNTASGQSSTAFGSQVTSSGVGSTAMGIGTLASGGYSTAMGGQTIASGTGSTTMGGQTTAASFNAVAMGSYNAITTGNASQNVATDAFFQIGNGNNNARSNALTILNNGNTAIGVGGTEAAAKPTERLDIGNADAPPNTGGSATGLGGVRIRAINSAAYTGNLATDRSVVADANGILKTVNRGYSTTNALPTGETWIDGKKVYKKVYPVTLNAAGDAGSITIDAGLGPVLNAEFAMTVQSGVYKRATLSGSSYNPSTGVLGSLSYSGAGITFPITLNLVVTYVEP